MSTNIIYLYLLGLLIVATITGGSVLKVLWGWFVAPTFRLPKLPLAAAIGMMILITYVINFGGTIGMKSYFDGYTIKDILNGFIASIGFSLFMLWTGWLISQFMPNTND